MRNLWWILLLGLLSPILAQKTVSIAPVRGEGFSPEELKVASSHFRDALLRKNAWQLVDASTQDAILQEQALGQTGCIASECLVAGSRQLGASHMAMLRLQKTGALLSAEAKLLEVATGKVERMAVVDGEGSLPEFASSKMDALIEALAQGLENGNTSKDSLVRKPAAVLDLEGNGLDSLTTKALSQRLRAELFRTGNFAVMEREDMEYILQEQAFQQTQCSGEDCATEVGRLVGVEQMVGGSVSRIGDLYSLSGRIIDVETGKILLTATVEMEGDLEKVLTEGLEDMARGLAGQQLRQRTDWVGWGWLMGGTLLAGLGGWQHYAAVSDNKAYNQESQDIDRLLSLKSSAKTHYWLAWAGYSLGAVSASVAVWHFGKPDRTLEVK